MCQLYPVRHDQFIYPARSEIWQIQGSIYFFSDLKQSIMHPAHMAHEVSVSVLRDIAAGVPRDVAHHEKIYISRSDTAFRRVSNEEEVWSALRDVGFSMVRLAEMSLHEQIATVRGAKVIVAPHGMGLTHIAFHSGKPLVLELHNSTIGTDTYAFIAHALGFQYRWVIGEDVRNGARDFRISPSAILESIA